MNGFMGRPFIWTDDNSSTPPEAGDREASRKDLGMPMNSITFCFLATAILILMFLAMAIFERLLGPRESHRSPPPPVFPGQQHSEMNQELHQVHLAEKMESSRRVTASNAIDFFVTMPGQICPTYIAKPAPVPCPREGMHWPSHGHLALASP